MTSSNTAIDHYNIVCDRLFSLKSWKYEDKSCLLHTIVRWTSQYEKSMPNKLEKNLRHLRQLLAERIVIQPMLPVEMILKVIQSDNIPSEAWRDCLLTALQSGMNDSSNPTTVSFDFAPVNVPQVDFDLQDQTELYLDDINLTHQLLSSELSSKITTTTAPNSLMHKEEPPHVYQMILRENLAELSQLKWDQSIIDLIESRFTSPEISNNVSSLKTALLIIETIVTNGISSRTHIERITNTIITCSIREWMKELNKIVDEQGKAKSVSVLLEELARENPSLNINKLEQRYRDVMRYYQTQASKMTSEHFRQQLTFDNELKTIAIIIQAAHLFKQYRPRDIQIISLLLLIENPGHNQGRLAQIRTGEGKSIIVSMCKYLRCSIIINITTITALKMKNNYV